MDNQTQTDKSNTQIPLYAAADNVAGPSQNFARHIDPPAADRHNISVLLLSMILSQILLGTILSLLGIISLLLIIMLPAVVIQILMLLIS